MPFIRPAVDAGPREAGDFAVGALGYEGRWLGAETFVSFDKKAIKLIEAKDVAARLLS